MSAVTSSAKIPAVDHRWRVRGVSLQGYSHLRDGIECQDAYRHAYVDAAGAHVLAVADGAGSRHRSAEGATLAVGLCVDILEQRLAAGAPGAGDAWKRLLSAAYQDVVTRFRAATTHLGSDPGAFAATLTAAVLAPPWLGIMSVGDGLVITRAESELVDDPFHLVAYGGGAGRYVNETVFLTSTGARSNHVIEAVFDPDLTAVVLATDGLVPLAVRGDGERRRPNESFLTPLLSTFDQARPDPTEIARFLLDDRISELSADDKTLLTAVVR